jgi:hypothetical protein
VSVPSPETHLAEPFPVLVNVLNRRHRAALRRPRRRGTAQTLGALSSAPSSSSRPKNFSAEYGNKFTSFVFRRLIDVSPDTAQGTAPARGGAPSTFALCATPRWSRHEAASTQRRVWSSAGRAPAVPVQ